MDDDAFHDLLRAHGEAITPASARVRRRRLLWMVLAPVASAAAAYLQR